MHIEESNLYEDKIKAQSVSKNTYYIASLTSCRLCKFKT